jgi:hypothetical protein
MSDNSVRIDFRLSTTGQSRLEISLNGQIPTKAKVKANSKIYFHNHTEDKLLFWVNRSENSPKPRWDEAIVGAEGVLWIKHGGSG